MALAAAAASSSSLCAWYVDSVQPCELRKMRGLLRWGWGRTGREEEKLSFGMGLWFTKFVLSNIFAVFSWCKGRGVFGVGKVGVFVCAAWCGHWDYEVLWRLGRGTTDEGEVGSTIPIGRCLMLMLILLLERRWRRFSAQMRCRQRWFLPPRISFRLCL